MESLRKYQHLSWLLLLIPIYLFLFVKLGSAHIRLWDEGWFAVHAVEMLQHKSWFVSYFNGQPSFTSSKPPLQTWLQMISISALGINELALRLPSALAATASVFLVFFSVKKHVGTSVAAMASMILLTSVGFVGFHTARGAEADALLTLMLLLQAWAVFQFALSNEPKWIYIGAAFLALGFLTKSVATFLFIPGFLVYMIVYRWPQTLDLLKSPHLYFAITIGLAAIIGYVILRNAQQPGYLDMFLRSNVGRYTASVGHDQSFEFYLRHMLDGRYMWWMPFALIGMVLALSRAASNHPLVVFATILAISYFLVISFSRSKLTWYDMPFYPVAAITAAFAIDQLLKSQAGMRKAVLTVVLFAFPTYNMFLNAQANRLNLQEMNYESQEIFLSQASRQQKDVDGLVVIHNHFDGSLLFYKHKLADQGQHIVLQNSLDGLDVGSKVLILDEHLKTQLFAHFDADTLDALRDAVMYELKHKKQASPYGNEPIINNY